jgi:hypothetical protein
LDVIVGEYVQFYLRENASKTGVDGAWRFCTNELVTAYAVKVAFFHQMQFCSAKRHSQAMASDVITL